MPVAKAFFDVLKVDKLGTHGIGRHRSLRRQKSESIERVGLPGRRQPSAVRTTLREARRSARPSRGSLDQYAPKEHSLVRAILADPGAEAGRAKLERHRSGWPKSYPSAIALVIPDLWSLAG